MTVYEFLGAFGVGGLITALIQFFVSERPARRRAVVQERREAYFGFLSVFSRYVYACGCQTGDGEDRDAVRAELGNWHSRVFLVSSREVAIAAKELIWAFEKERRVSNPDPKSAYSRMVMLMREDLGVSDARGEPFKDWIESALPDRNAHETASLPINRPPP